MFFRCDATIASEKHSLDLNGNCKLGNWVCVFFWSTLCMTGGCNVWKFLDVYNSNACVQQFQKMITNDAYVGSSNFCLSVWHWVFANLIKFRETTQNSAIYAIIGQLAEPKRGFFGNQPCEGLGDNDKQQCNNVYGSYLCSIAQNT